MMGTKPDDPSIEVKLSVARQLLCLHESGSQTLVDPDTVLPWDLPALGGLTLKCSVQIKLTRNSPEWVLNLGGRPVRVIYQPDLNDDPTKFKYIDARVFEVIDSGDVNLKLSNLPFGPGLVSFYLYEMGGSVKNPYAAPPGYSEAVAQFSSKKDYDDFFQGPPPAAPSIHHLGSFRLGSINP